MRHGPAPSEWAFKALTWNRRKDEKVTKKQASVRVPLWTELGPPKPYDIWFYSPMQFHNGLFGSSGVRDFVPNLRSSCSCGNLGGGTGFGRCTSLCPTSKAKIPPGCVEHHRA